MSVTRALETVEHSHVAVVMIDASRGLVQQDKAIADKVCKQAKSCILVGNKSDLLSDKEWEAFKLKVETDLKMISWAPLVRASVLTGQGVEEAMELVVEAGRWRRERLPKAPLNDVFQDALMIRPLPRTKTGGIQKLRYALQLETETPTFVLHMNRNVQLHSSDQKYVENIIRKRWPYTATPLRIQYKGPDRSKKQQQGEGSALRPHVDQRKKRSPKAGSRRYQ